ncbi:MAG: SGNH/GDSL hydrolase family protein [Armatimonadota bacterium]
MIQSYDTIVPDDARLIWSGAISLQHGPGWVMPWRLPYPDLVLFPPVELQDRAAMPSGVRLHFATDATSMTVVTEPMVADGNLDLYADDVLLVTTAFKEGDTIHRYQLPDGMKTLELWLHQMTPFRLREIQLNPGAQLERSPDTRPKWITYGSSITHCGAASSPSNIWPGVVARAMGLNLTALGYGGHCHAEPMVARMIRDLPADLISVKLGINIHGQGSLNGRTFLPAVIGTIATIREGHPNTPFIVCSPIWSPPRERTPNGAGMTLELMREDVEHAVSLFRDRGDDHLYYINGLDLFGHDYADHLPDQLHPDAKGYVQLGLNFVREVCTKCGVTLPKRMPVPSV